jgi:hypothetical protein
MVLINAGKPAGPRLFRNHPADPEAFLEAAKIVRPEVFPIYIFPIYN